MALEPEINCPDVAQRIAEFIGEKCRALKRDGAILGMSGGLDSSTTAALCARSLGLQRVLGLILPEREGDPQNVADAEEVARWLGVRTRTCDMTAALRHIGAYGHVLSKVPSRPLRELVARATRRLLRPRAGEAPLLSTLKRATRQIGGREGPYCLVKHRLRMVMVYLHAERENLMVVGCANRTEWMTGVFSSFGVDHCADIMPIIGLYHSQVARLARHLGVPERIVAKQPDTGLLAGVRDKYRHLFGMDAPVLDAILVGLDRGMPVEDIASTLAIEPEAVRGIARRIELSAHKRTPPAAPAL